MELSETFLKNLVNEVRKCLTTNGITVDERKDPFDMPLAVVKESYPVEDVLPNLTNITFHYNLESYYVAGVIIRV